MPGKLGRRRLAEERVAAASHLLHILYNLEVDRIKELDGVQPNKIASLLSRIDVWINPKHDINAFVNRLTKKRKVSKHRVRRLRRRQRG